ncbi:MAG: cyclophilin-like fold protein [Moorellales bacterium]
MQAVLKAGEIEVRLKFNATATAAKIWGALPLEAEANTWGDEVYFTIPVEAEPEAPQELVEAGDVAYWPPGRALCLFFGPTPISGPGEIRPYSPVTVVGRVLGDPQVLKAVRSGQPVRVVREGERG